MTLVSFLSDESIRAHTNTAVPVYARTYTPVPILWKGRTFRPIFPVLRAKTRRAGFMI